MTPVFPRVYIGRYGLAPYLFLDWTNWFAMHITPFYWLFVHESGRLGLGPIVLHWRGRK